jgi:transcriptional regulator with XRE-family HTH domain
MSLGMTGKQLASLTGISSAYLSQLEAGKRDAPSPDVIAKLADSLQLTVGELLAEAPSTSPPTAEVPVIGVRHPTPAPCPACQGKDAEIAYLRTQLAAAIERIPKP